MIDPAAASVRHRPDVTADDIASILAEGWGLTVRQVSELPAELARIYDAATDNGRFALRVASSEGDAWGPVQDLMLDAFSTAPDVRSPVLVTSRGGDTAFVSGNNATLTARLMTWVEGRRIADFRRRPTTLLRAIGATAAHVRDAINGVIPPPEVEPVFLWDLRRSPEVVNELSPSVPAERQRHLLERIVERAQAHIGDRWGRLPVGWIHGDLNDHNLLVDATGDIGVIDVTDAHWSFQTAELAIAAAYGALGSNDPIEAMVRIVAGAHEHRPLDDDEMAVVVPLAALRLAVSVAVSANRSERGDDGEYVTVSETTAWNVLEHLDGRSFGIAELLVRQGCGVDPSPLGTAVLEWMGTQRGRFSDVLGVPHDAGAVCAVDWSVTSTAADHPDLAAPMDRQCRAVALAMTDAGAAVGIGRHGEPRIVYAAPEFATSGFDGPRWRTVHLGVDMSCPAGTTVLALTDGVVHRVDDDAVDRGYGPVITLRHTPPDGPEFFTLYGHLSRPSVSHLSVGDPIRTGDRIATVGSPVENGGWVPHLHFQVIADHLGIDGPFPGVATSEDWRAWSAVCPSPHDALGLPESVIHFPEPDEPTVAAEHRDRLPTNQSVSYSVPLVAVRGSGVWLYDAWGRGHLDTVNNVAHVGHQHPRVTEAIRRQTSLLDTNSRYPHPERVRYLGRLAERFPDQLDTVYLVSSGSEANELALRIARAVTRRRAVVALEGAYHGNTGALVDVSAYKHDGPGGAGPPPWVGVVPLPDPYRHPDRVDPQRWRRSIGNVIASLDQPVAAVIAESIPGVAGQVVLPDGFLADLFEEVGRRGGLRIADEVQVGLGRPGTSWWGFERDGVVPDIVTLGKPLGNGFPLGAVVTSHTIAKAFDPGMEFFATFGGNPVACAAGNAVLDVIADEELRPHAARIGERLRNGFEDLSRDHPIIGDVRGAGLFLGVELVRDPTAKTPASNEARYVAERARRRGVLLSVDGLHHNVLKFKPPLVFDDDHVDQVLDTLSTILGEEGAKPHQTWAWTRDLG